jgi:hypothetical protein
MDTSLHTGARSAVFEQEQRKRTRALLFAAESGAIGSFKLSFKKKVTPVSGLAGVTCG